MIHYSSKYPSISDYRNVLSFWQVLFIIVICFLITFSLLNYKQQILYFIIVFVFWCSFVFPSIMMLRTIGMIHELIKKIEKVFKENLSLSINGGKYSEHLLLCNVNYDVQRANEKKFFIVLSIILIISVIISEYIKCEEMKFIVWTGMLLLYFGLANIFRFFHEIDTLCFSMVFKDKEFVQAFFKENLAINWTKYQNKWKTLISVIIFLFILTILSLFSAIIFWKIAIPLLSLINLIASIIMVKDIGTIVKSNLIIMGQYDEFSKAKIGVTFISEPQS